MATVRFAAAVVVLVAACGDGGPEPFFPADTSAFVEVRGCRRSADHDLGYIRVLADPAALVPYRDRAAPFPAGAVVLKVEYDFADGTCAGPIRNFTAMRRDAVDDPQRLGWSWQRVDADRAVESEDDGRCIGCHAQCGVAPDGYLGTCAVP